MKAAIIFDMDGTLFQTNLILERALEATFEHLRKHGHWTGETPLAQYRNIMGVPLPVVWETLCPNHSAALRAKSNDLFQKALITHITARDGALYDGVEQTLATLSKQYPLFIASNGETDYLHAIADTYSLTNWIDGIYSIDRIASGNKSELVQTILQEHGIASGFVVGDRLSDFQAAIDNGLQAIGVRFHFAQQHELDQAHYVVDAFPDIVAITTKQ